MLLVQLILQVLELSVDPRFFLGLLSLLLLGEGLFVLLVKRDGKLVVVGLILDDRMLKVILLVQFIDRLGKGLLLTREHEFVV